MKIIKEAINSWRLSFKVSIRILLFAVFALFFTISYYSLQKTVDNFIAITKIRVWMVENAIKTSIDDSYQIMYALSDRLKHEPIRLGNQNIQKIVDSFDYELNFRKFVPLYSLKVFDIDDIAIYRSAEFSHIFTPTKSTRHLDLLAKIRKDPLGFQVGTIRLGTMRHKEDILPFCMSINNIDKKYIGGICSGLMIGKLNTQLNSNFSTNHSSKIKLLSKNIFHNKDNNYEISKVVTIANLLRYCLFGDDFIVHFALDNYPIILELEVNFYYLAKSIVSNIIFCVCYFILFCVFYYYLFIINRKFYLQPFDAIQQKLSILLADILKTNDSNAGKLQKLQSVGNNSANLTESISDVIDYCYLLHVNAQKNILQQSAMDLRERILHLILTEKHYASSNISNKINVGTLYLGHLRNLINEKCITSSLLKYFQDVIEYCCEYHHELNIKIMVNKKDCKDFTFKHAALTEAIFHIFTLITRLGKFDIENKEIIIKGSFYNKNKFPTISIETMLSDSSIRSLGWISGPSYVYTGFLSIYLLARENNLQFYVEQKDQSVIFILDPIEVEQLEEVSNHYLNLI